MSKTESLIWAWYLGLLTVPVVLIILQLGIQLFQIFSSHLRAYKEFRRNKEVDFNG